ncbi:MAG: formate--tetrahydrofolate ligase, partial [Oscillospiraceae bacterium]
DNHIQQGNALNIDVRRITWRRCVDMNDRQLRNITCGLGGKMNGVPREDGYDITVASEIMAVLCLSTDLVDLKARLGRMVVAYTRQDKPVYASDLKAQGAMTALLKDAIRPNLVQTLEHTPTLIHGGPFANIAHGCNSVFATDTALKLGDYVVTEAGFGADLGAEKFLDIKCRAAGLTPAAVVIVATVRALKQHGLCPREERKENVGAVEQGLPNLLKHVENMKNVYGLPTVVAINRFRSDTDRELEAVRVACGKIGVNVALCEVWEKGGEGGETLAQEVLRVIAEEENRFQYSYELHQPLKQKIEAIAKRIYGADGVDYSPAATKELAKLEELGYGDLPICMAKTQYSLSDDPTKLGAPHGFRVTVQKAKVSAGAGFVVVLTGDIMTMPGLPKIPAAENIDVDENGKITGLF